MNNLANKLVKNETLTHVEFLNILENRAELQDYLTEAARKKALERFSNKIYIRGLIEFTNFCKNDCYYCGIRAGNDKADRYRLSDVEILESCAIGHGLGYRTFVLQGGEDPYFTDEKICKIVSRIKSKFDDCAVTLSIGEKSYDSYKKYFDAGADRYLLRHETASEAHYQRLHPKNMSLENRKRCLWNLKEIGYQVGAGFMVGSPYQTLSEIAEDLCFLAELRPEMVGIGPFIRHHDTIFANFPTNTIDLTLYLISILRLMLPDANIPATTAVGTLDPQGREKAILRGANVLMSNVSPTVYRKKYELYDDKICTGEEAAECAECLKRRVLRAGYEIVTDRGDFKARG